jgi:molecular chaperone DnaK
MVIGIDLGTTFSVAAYVDKNGFPRVIPNSDGQNTTPSVVMFDHGEVIVGVQAKNNAMTSPYSIAQFAKRHIGEKFKFVIDDESGTESTYSPEEISAIVLKKIKLDCERALDEEVTGAVITVPAYFSDAQKNATITAGKIAGLEVLKIIHEPTAAAIAFGLDKAENKTKVIIYDLGGGTFDVTAAEIDGKNISVLASDGLRTLGGADFDNKLIEYAAGIIEEQTGIDPNEEPEDLQLLRQRCEEAKIALSTRTNYTFTMSLQRKKAKVDISRSKFEELIMPLIEMTGIPIDTVFEESGYSAKDFDKVLLVGASSIIPAVGEFVFRKLGIKPSSELNPHEVVAIGAAICANSIESYTEKKKRTKNPDADASDASSSVHETEMINADHNDTYNLTEKNSHGFGVVIHDDGQPMNSVIIPRNQPLLKPFTKVYSTSSDDQTAIKVQVTEGEEADIDYVTIIGDAEMNLEPHPEGSPIAVEFRYDENGVIMGKVFDLFGVHYTTDEGGYLPGGVSALDNPKFIGEVVIKRKNEMSDEDIIEKKQSMTSLTIQ